MSLPSPVPRLFSRIWTDSGDQEFIVQLGTWTPHTLGRGGDIQEARNLKILWKSKEQNKTQSRAHTSSLHAYIQVFLEIKGIRGYGEMQKQSEIKPAGWACCHICFHLPWGGECRGSGRRRGPKRQLSCSIHLHTLRCLVSGEAFPLGPRGETPPGCLLKAWGATHEKGGGGCEVAEHDWTLCSEVCGAPGHRWI